MDLLRYQRRTSISVRIRGRSVWPLGIHWLGRSMLCTTLARAECPACHGDRAKLRAYCLAESRRHTADCSTGMIELPGTVFEQLVEKGMEPHSACGFTFSMEKLDGRFRWNVTQVAFHECEPSPDELLPLSLEALFGLPRSVQEDGTPEIVTDREAWLRGHARAIRAKLAFVCQNGSHRIA